MAMSSEERLREKLRKIEALYAAGAAACLTKDQELDEIVNALLEAAA